MSHCHINLASHSSPIQSLLLKNSKRTHTRSSPQWFFLHTRPLFGEFFVWCFFVSRFGGFFAYEICVWRIFLFGVFFVRRFFAHEICVWRCVLQLAGGCAGLMVGKEKTHLTTLNCKSISLFHLNTDYCWCWNLNRQDWTIYNLWFSPILLLFGENKTFRRKSENINYHSFPPPLVDSRGVIRPKNEIKVVENLKVFLRISLEIN